MTGKIVCAAALAVAGTVWGDVPGLNRAKVVGFGWDTLGASAQEILENAEAFDRSGLDGVFVMVGGRRGDGTRFTGRELTRTNRWTTAMFRDDIAALSQFGAHRGLRESMPFAWFASKRRLSWDDDAAWDTLANNVAVLASVAKAAGLKGIQLDNEDYPGQRQYWYSKGKDGASFDAACAAARRRGADVGRRVFAAFPEVVMGFLWILSEHRPYFTCADPEVERRACGDLWPSFVNGLLDVIPPTAKLVDGDEHCYYADAEGHDFYRHFWNQRQGALRLVAPENRVKYQSQVSVSGGIYLDMFTNPKGHMWYFGPGADGTRTSRFAAILAEGAYVATDYVWLYGEKHALIDWRTDSAHCNAGKDKRFDKVRAEGRYTWEIVLPGYTSAVRLVTDPFALAVEAISVGTNLLDWSSYGSWQHERRSHGTFRVDREDKPCGEFSLVAKGVKQGCFTFSVPVKAGELYAVCGAVKGRGAITVTWSSNGTLTAVERQCRISVGAPDANGWAKGVTAVCVPPGMDKLVIHPGVSDQGPDEETKFAGIRVVKVSK